jgi:hypothetical protein
MERVLTAHRQLRCILWVAEAAIITICLITAYQIGMEAKDSTVWACAPILIIAVMETTRVPLAGWTAHLKPFAMFCGFVIMAAISVLTFEGMSYGVERFMHQRALDVLTARDVLDAAKQKAQDVKDLVAKQTAEVEKRRQLVADLEGQTVTLTPLPQATIPCTRTDWNNKKHLRQVPSTCQNPAANEATKGNTKAMAAHAKEVAEAHASLTEAEDTLKKLQSADGLNADDAVIAAQKAVATAAANSTMYRTAATWFGVPVKDLTDAQFERFKRIAVAALAGATAVATMLLAFISHATPRLPTQKGKLIRAIRAYIARKRKNVVRERIVEKPTGVKTVEVPKIVEVERVITKHIHVPADVNTWRVINADGSLGDRAPLHVVQGGKQ